MLIKTEDQISKHCWRSKFHLFKLCELLIMRMIKRTRKELVLLNGWNAKCNIPWTAYFVIHVEVTEQYPLNMRSEYNVYRLPLGVGHIFVHSRQESSFSYTVSPNLTLIFLPHALLRKLTFLFLSPFCNLRWKFWLTILSTRAPQHVTVFDSCFHYFL